MKSPLRNLPFVVLIIMACCAGTLCAQTPGISWIPRNNGLEGRSVFSLARSPKGVVFAGSSNRDIYVSKNQGKTWSRIQLQERVENGTWEEAEKVVAIVAGSDGNNLAAIETGTILSFAERGKEWSHQVMASALGRIHSLVLGRAGSIFVSNNNSVLFSSDGGTTWIPRHNGFQGFQIETMAGDSAGVLFIGVWGKGVYRSSDDGETWIQVNKGLKDLNVCRLAVNSRGALLAGTFNAGIFSLKDTSAGWEHTLKWRSIHAIGVYRNEVFASDNGGFLFHSTNDGNTWEEFLGENLSETNTKSLLVEPQGHLLLGSEFFGVYRSTDRGRKWRQSNTGMINPYVVSISGSGGVLVAGLQTGSIFYSTNEGSSWFKAGLPKANAMSVGVDAAGYFYALVNHPGTDFVRSDDRGKTWSSLRQGLPATSFSTLMVDGKGEIFLGTHGAGLYSSTTQGEVWTDRTRENLDKRITVVSSPTTGFLYAGTYGGVFRSTNSCETWQPTTLRDMPVVTLLSLGAGEIYAGTKDGGMFFSADSGSTWTKTSFPSPNVTSMNVDNRGTIFAGTDEGVYYSEDKGQTWLQANKGLTSTHILGLWKTRKGKILAATFGGGIFQTSSAGKNQLSAPGRK